MTKTSLIFIILLAYIFVSCNNKSSISQSDWTSSEDLKTNLKNEEKVEINSNNNILICNPVYITKNGEVVNNTNFIYGDKFKIHFDNIEGFNNVEGKMYPELSLFVLDSLKDTVFVAENLYKGKGYDYQELSLSSYIKCGDPMHSNRTYTAYVNVWDTKGKGTYNCNFKFTIKPNNKIKNISNGISFNEIYLFSKDKGKAITDNKVAINESNYLFFEGLSGFAEDRDGKVKLGMKSNIIDANGDTLFKSDNLFPDEPFDKKLIYEQCSYKFTISDANFAEPLKYTVIIWDKNSDKYIESKYDINVKK